MKFNINDLYVVGEPDYFDIMCGNECICGYDYESDDALPFVIGNGKLYIGGSGLGHSSCNYPDDIKDNKDYAFGRIWFCSNSDDFPYNILAFWYEDEKHTIDVKLVDELLNKCGINKKQVLVASFEEDDEGTLYPYTEWDFKITKSNERQQGIRAIHLMNANDKHDATTNFRTNRDRLIGKKLTNTKGDDEMTVAQYRSMIYGENKKRIGIIIREVINKYLKQNIS